jgi:nucleolin
MGKSDKKVSKKESVASSRKQSVDEKKMKKDLKKKKVVESSSDSDSDDSSSSEEPVVKAPTAKLAAKRPRAESNISVKSAASKGSAKAKSAKKAD